MKRPFRGQTRVPRIVLMQIASVKTDFDDFRTIIVQSDSCANGPPMAKNEANSSELKKTHDSPHGRGRRPSPMEKSCAYFELARFSFVFGHGFSISTRNFLLTVAQYYK